MNPNLIQQIFDELQDYIPDDWEKVVLRVESIPDVTSSIIYYVNTKKGYVDCFKLNIDIKELLAFLARINSLLVSERDSLPQKDQWRVFTLVVKSTGDFNVYFDYDYTGDDIMTYDKKWEKKYLV